MSDPVRDAIVMTLRGVDGIGVVHDRERFAERQGDFRALYMQSPDAVNGWFVRFESRRETQQSIGRYIVTVQWRIMGYHGFDDEANSEGAFKGVVDAAADAFRTDDTLGGTVLDTLAPGSDESGLQVDVVQTVMFAGVLCHQANCRLLTRYLV